LSTAAHASTELEQILQIGVVERIEIEGARH
jgi:hypothetical protein